MAVSSEPDACHALADIADRVATTAASPRTFLRLLGRDAAGIRLGLLGAADLLRGGTNPITGGGLQPGYSDGSAGQVRHFAGTAAAAALVGPGLASWLSVHLGRDSPDTPDGRLSRQATAFAGHILTGTVRPDDAGGWIRRNICG